MPDPLAAWASGALRVDISGREAEISPREIYVALPRPGGDAWFSLDRKSGEARYELTDRGWISYLNDLHKGRNTGAAWSLFLDVFAVACIVFCVTGLVLLQLLSHARPSTWPLVGLGSCDSAADRDRFHSLRTDMRTPLLISMTGALAVPAAFAAEMTVSVEIPRLNVAEYHRPYVAIWLEKPDQSFVGNIAVWYDLKLKDNEGTKWLKDMRQWWRKSGRELTMPVDGLSSATRAPGEHKVAVALDKAPVKELCAPATITL